LLGAPELAFVINGATFLISAATLLFIHIPPREAPETAEDERRRAGSRRRWRGSGFCSGRTMGYSLP